jgi:hypothetical protein
MTRASKYSGFGKLGIAGGIVTRMDVPTSAIVGNFRTDAYQTVKGTVQMYCACDFYGQMCLYHWYYEMKLGLNKENVRQPYAQQAQPPQQADTGHRGDSGAFGVGPSGDGSGRGHSSVRGDSPQSEIRSPRRSRRRQ